MNLFNWYSNAAGKIRAINTFIAAAVALAMSPAFVDVPWVAPIAVGLLAVQQFLTRFTSVGNGTPAP